MAKVSIARVVYTGSLTRVFLSNGDELVGIRRIDTEAEVAGFSIATLEAAIIETETETVLNG